MNNSSNRTDGISAEGDQNHCVYEETSEVVRKYLQRSLSQNAKNSMEFMKPEGYHKLKKMGKLHHYHRQQSKPEDGSPKNSSLLRRKSVGTATLTPTREGARSAGQVLSSLTELRDETKDHDQVPNHFRSDNDLRTNEVLSEKTLMYQLLSSETTVVDGHFPSLESFSSANEEEAQKMRRISFTKAVSREPLLSLSDNLTDHPAENGESKTNQQLATESKDQAHKRTHSLSPSRDDMTLTHGGKPVKKFSFRERIRNIIPSNKRKLKTKKALDGSQGEDVSDGLRSDECRAHSADPRLYNSIERDFRREIDRNSQPSTASVVHSSRAGSMKTLSLKRKTSSRTPSPIKSKSPLTTPKFLRRPFTHKKASPKLKSHSFHHSPSTQSLGFTSKYPAISEHLEKNKSGSLPNTVRLTVNQSVNQRRASMDTAANKLHSHKHKKDETHERKHADDHAMKKVSKLRKFFRIFRKRHVSESSTTSSHSVSLPSIPAAVEQDEQGNEIPKADGRSSSGSDYADRSSTLAPSDDRYHHRGSMSLSSVNLDRLTDPEKQKVYEEIADSLSRLSSKFSEYIHKRSLRDSPPNETSNIKGRSSLKTSLPRNSSKSEHLFNPNEVTPSLSAYYNLSPRKRKESGLDKSAAVMPGSTPMRRVYHSKSKSLDSHRECRGHLKVPEIVLERPSPESGDVVDGFVPGGVEEMEMDSNLVESDSVDKIESDSPTLYYLERGSDVDGASSLLHPTPDRPSTSSMDDDIEYEGEGNAEEYDEDKIVEALVNLLRKTGDEFQDSVDMNNGVPFGPVFSTSIVNTIGRSTYSTFQSVAARFCSNCRRLVERSPERHPEIFSIVMVAQMTRLICNMANSDTASQAASHTTRFITEFVEASGNTLNQFLDQLRETENEFTEDESSQERRPPTD